MSEKTTENRSWLKTLWAKYNELCDDLGVDNGACRSCVPVVKFDPETNQAQSKTEQSEENQSN
ncbi:MAG: DUF5363 domain-containing protein [Pasteurellaceae bacterium]|nr:DUF5363 domain-containing protein [Pasteurellaceae bacterium]